MLFYGYVVSDGFNKGSRDEDNFLNFDLKIKIKRIKFVRIFTMMI